MDFSRLKLTIDHRIAHIQLDRPNHGNAFDLTMFKELEKALRLLKKNRSIRAVVLSGSGNDFSTGIDVKSTLNDPRAVVRLLFKWTPWQPNLVQKICVGWRTLPYPVICAIQGRCWGAGLQLALCCDFRIAHPNSELSIMETKWGLVPDMGGSLALRELLPIDQAMKISMTSEIITGENALTMNLVTQLQTKPQQYAHHLAHEFINQSPDALAAIKKHYLNIGCRTDRRVLASEWFNQLRMIIAPNTRVAARRNTTPDRPPFLNRLWW